VFALVYGRSGEGVEKGNRSGFTGLKDDQDKKSRIGIFSLAD
jgi:hypothetical protein